jgi:glycosyltransferase involved in cell wall biosynthesis
MRVYLEQSVRALGLQDSIQLCGKLENTRVHEVFAETDVLLLPSVWPENQPVSITEAMAASIPTIASRIGGIPELVADGVTGRLVEPGNAKDLSSAMRTCIENGETRENWGAAAFERIRGHTFEAQVKEIVKVYDELS